MTTNFRTKKIKGVKYSEMEYGILVPESLVREAGNKVRQPQDAWPLLASIAHDTQENVMILTLDGNAQLIRRAIVTRGLANQCQIHPREVFRTAIVDGACSVMLAHNHPSGSLEPSEPDLTATRRISEAGRTIGISLLDHLIVSRNGIYSIRENFPGYFA